MFKKTFSFKRLMLTLVIVSAVLFIISACKPKGDDVPVDSVTISTVNDVSVINTIGGTLQFTAVVLPTNADNKAVTWSVTNGTGEATISSNGLLSAVADGTVTVKAASNSDPARSATKLITISNQNVLASSISLTSEDDRSFIDDYQGTLQMGVIVLPASAVNKDVIWSVENGSGSATINANGLLTAVSNGTVIVRATSAAVSSVFGTKTITISNQDTSAVLSVEISSADDVVIIDTFQGTLQFVAEVLPADAEDKSITWSVINGTGSGTITENGLLTAVSNGTLSVRATSVSNPSVFDELEVTISNQEVIVTSVVLTSANDAQVIDVFGGTLQFDVEVLPADAVDKAVTWSVENGSGSATISQTGLLSATSDGTVTVYVTSNSNSAINDSMLITISNQEIVVTSISVNGNNDAEIIDELDGTLQMNAIVLPANAADTSVVWSVENGTGSATINVTGLLTAISNGTVTVIATSVMNEEVFGTKEITISNQNVVPTILPVNLHTANDFAILAKEGLVATGTSAINGNVGVSQADVSAITGLGLIMDSSDAYATSTQIIGMVYAANFALPTPSYLLTAGVDLEAAYDDAEDREADFTNLYDGELGGQTLYEGVYYWNTDVEILENLTLSGDADDVIIFQISGTFSQAAGTEIILTGGLLAENVFWQVSDTVLIGANAHFEGILLALESVTLASNASLNGKIFSQTTVYLNSNVIN